MASTVVCRASSPQLGSHLNQRWKIPYVVPPVPFLGLSIFIESEPRIRHAEYLSNSAVAKTGREGGFV